MLLLLILIVALLWLAGAGQSNDSTSPASPPPTSPAGSDVSSYNPLTQLTNAWANAEGWNVAGSLAQRNNNPVNLKGDWPGVVGHTEQGFAIFDSPDSGFAAAQNYVQRNATAHPGWTLQNFFAKVLGSLSGTPVNDAQGISDQEASNVASYLGIPSNTVLSQYLGVN